MYAAVVEIVKYLTATSGRLAAGWLPISSRISCQFGLQVNVMKKSGNPNFRTKAIAS